MMQEDLTQSGNTGVRWQAQMEEHLKRVRELTRILTPSAGAAANANAIAALALALSNGLGDLESGLTKFIGVMMDE
jgi:hypothetical protein